MKRIDLSKIYSINNLFFNCSSLISLPDISKWELFNSNINNYDFDLNLESKFSSELNDEEFLKSLFPRIVSYHNDIYLDNIMIVLPKLNSYKKEEMKQFFLNGIYKMDRLFAGCSSLKYLPNISKWNIKNTTDIRLMFAGCTSLIYLPDISNWNTQNITKLSHLFYNCSSLKSLPDISKWNINNVNDILYLKK